MFVFADGVSFIRPCCRQIKELVGPLLQVDILFLFRYTSLRSGCEAKLLRGPNQNDDSTQFYAIREGLIELFSSGRTGLYLGNGSQSKSQSTIFSIHC